MGEPKYDVAISFLWRDEPTAKALHEKLSLELTVFFSPRNQEELAGTDGMESMRAPFREQSRLNVVLFRTGWGETPWTRVEGTAILERCLADGWRTLFFVVLDDRFQFPKWLPETHMRLNWSEYGLEQAVGAIKLRVQEEGGKLTRVDATSRAKIVQQEATYREERKRRFGDQRWITDVVQPAVAKSLRDMAALANRIASEQNVLMRSGVTGRRCVITNDRLGIAVSWSQEYSNSLDRAAFLVAKFNGQVMLPGEAGFQIKPPPEIERYRFTPELSRSLELCLVSESGSIISLEDFSDNCVQMYLDLLDREQQGDLPGQEGIFDLD